jgi:hypothetical protein
MNRGSFWRSAGPHPQEGTLDFTLTSEQEAFRERVRAWLEANIPDEWAKLGLSEVPRPEAYAFLRKW